MSKCKICGKFIFGEEEEGICLKCWRENAPNKEVMEKLPKLEKLNNVFQEKFEELFLGELGGEKENDR